MRGRVLGAMTGLALLAGCAAPVVVAPPSPEIAPAPALPAPAPAQPPYAGPSARSQELADHYARMQAQMLARGAMRRDGGAGVPFSAEDLVRNFVAIALRDEPLLGGGPRTPATLRRWEKPVRVGIHFGASVSPAQQVRDRGQIASLLRRLSEVTGHPIGLTADNPNLTVFIVDEDERRALDSRLAAALPGLSARERARALDMPRALYCAAYTYSYRSAGYSNAIVLIRAEHPQLLRESCFHEEIAQALGLPSDSPAARPSIFNDDEEFALLTRHDEALLRILYDRRLRPGMTEAQARPILKTIAAELAAPTS